MERINHIFLLIFTGAWLRWLWTDDKTGKHSDTTLRMNLLFFALFSIVISGVIRLLTSNESISTWMPLALDFLNYLGPIAGGGAIAFGYKRWSEMRNSTQRGDDFYPGGNP